MLIYNMLLYKYINIYNLCHINSMTYTSNVITDAICVLDTVVT